MGALRRWGWKAANRIEQERADHMTGKYTPKELEDIVLHELRKQGAFPDGLRVQILRAPGGWRPTLQAMPPDAAPDLRNELASKISKVGDELAPNHDLMGS
jgi:hypothetical protein